MAIVGEKIRIDNALNAIMTAAIKGCISSVFMGLPLNWMKQQVTKYSQNKTQSKEKYIL